MNVAIAAAATGLNLHHRIYDKQINQKIRNGMELEYSLTPVKALHTYVAPNAEIQSVVQAYQGGFTPRDLGLEFNAVENYLQRMKIDIQFTADDIDQFYDSWMTEWIEDGKSRKEWTFPRYVYEVIIMPQIEDDMDHIAYNGEFVAPTPGTAGITVNACDGLRKKLVDAQVAGDLTPIPTGALVANTIVNQLESFCDAIPGPYRDIPGEIRMSKTNARKYWRDYRSLFGTGNSNMGNENNQLRIDATNKVIKGFSSMEGTDGIIFSPKRNLIVGHRRGQPRMPVIRWQEQDRLLKGLTEFSRFFGLKFYDNCFTNDQL